MNKINIDIFFIVIHDTRIIGDPTDRINYDQLTVDHALLVLLFVLWNRSKKLVVLKKCVCQEYLPAW